MSRAGARALAAAAMLTCVAARAGAGPKAPRVDCAREPAAEERSVGGYYEGRFGDDRRVAANLPYESAPAQPPARARGSMTPHEAVPPEYWIRSPEFDGHARHLAVAPEGPAVPAADGGFTFVVVEKRDGRSDVLERFEGRFSTDRREATGTWSDLRNGGRQLAFKLERVAEYRRLALVEKRPRRNDGTDIHRAPFVFGATWPAFSDAGITAVLRRATTTCFGQAAGLGDEWHQALVRWHGPDATAVLVHDEAYAFGAPHEAMRSRVFNFASGGGRASRPRQLRDVVVQTPACLASVRRDLAAKLATQGGVLADHTPLDDGHVLAVPGGLLFTFDPYVVSSYAQGRVEGLLTREELGACAQALPGGP